MAATGPCAGPAGQPSSRRPRFYIRTLGCKVNQAESERIAAALARAGWQPDGAAQADVRIVNTCTVTGEADAKNRKAIRQLLRAGDAPVIVTGCAVNVDPAHYSALDPRVVCERDKDALPALAARLASVDAELPGSRQHAPFPGQRTRASVKVQDGCDNACTFCIVHTARGPARSKPLEDVVAEVSERADHAPELVLAGIDLAAYRSGSADVAELARTLLERTHVGRVRITSVEPQSVTDSLVELLAHGGGRVCRHLHLCLQSGSDKVLHEMGRRYSAEEFYELAGTLKAAVPGIALSGDVLVGFPGETDADFEDSARLVEQVGFMRLHVFRYSPRPGTPAAARADQIDPSTAAERARRLQKLGVRLAREDRERRAGTVERAVVERAGTATSESYHTVRCSTDIPAGALVDMRLEARDDGELAGTLV